MLQLVEKYIAALVGSTALSQTPAYTPRNGYRASKGKGKAEHLYSALHRIQTTLKRSGMDQHRFSWNKHHACLYLVIVHQMEPPPIDVANI